MGILPKMTEAEALDLADKSVGRAKSLVGLLCDGMGDGDTLETSSFDPDNVFDTVHLLHDLLKDAKRALAATSEFHMARIDGARDRRLAG